MIDVMYLCELPRKPFDRTKKQAKNCMKQNDDLR